MLLLAACAQEPSPFSHVSGMKNRFESLIQGLRAAGDDVMVFTPDRHPPDDYHGARVIPPSCPSLFRPSTGASLHGMLD